MKTFNQLLGVFLSLGTAMIGYQIHHSLFWSVIDFCFAPIAWIKWLVCQEVTWGIIKSAFTFFFQ